MRLRSPKSAAQFVVVRVSSEPVELLLNGDPLTDLATPGDAIREDGPELSLGKRYVDQATALELLCTHAGFGEIQCNGVVMELMTAKPLPASD